MAALKEIIAEIDRLKAEADSFGKLDQDARERLEQKVRMEWNYHSNAIEGNQLDYGETRSLILHDLTADGKPFKHHQELKGHNEVLKKFFELSTEEIRITENVMKDYHEMMLGERYKNDPKIATGQYKEGGNYLHNDEGERIDFLHREVVPERLNALVNLISNEINPPKRKRKGEQKHLLLTVALFHDEFIHIHPFEDGNGRICRIMMNLILKKAGYPPIIVKVEDRKSYINSLDRAREQGVEYLAVFLGKQLIASLELYLKAAKGEPLEEADDLDKKLFLLGKELEEPDEEKDIKWELTGETYRQIQDEWLQKLFDKLVAMTVKFNRFYTNPGHRVRIAIDNNSTGVEATKTIDWQPIAKWLDEQFDRSYVPQQINIELHTSFGAFRKGGLDSFGCQFTFTVKFSMLKYKIMRSEFDKEPNGQNQLPYTERLLHQPVTEEEIEKLAQQWGETLLQHIEYHRAKTDHD